MKNMKFTQSEKKSSKLNNLLFYGKVVLLQMLIDKGAPVMEKDNGGDAPMHWAAKRGFMKIMCTMRSAGACPKLPGEYSLKNTHHFSYHATLFFP